MQKVINPIFKKTYGGRYYNVFIRISITDEGNLSISGVEGPLSSRNCFGSCGQIYKSLREEDRKDWTYKEGWNKKLMDQLLEVWDKWHLNDMHAECTHQRARGENWNNNPSAVCPDCGWKLGHGWAREELPEEVVTFLKSLPNSKVKPAWV